jgi:mono/diheme cytochrome c family protein
LKTSHRFLGLCACLILAACGGGTDGDEGAPAQGAPPPISSQAAPAADEATQGKELFLSYGCAVCHGEEGRGDGITSTATPVKPRDFHDRSAYKLGNTAEAISRTIQEGITTSGMPAYGHIPEDERLLIAKYVVSLQGKP